MLDQKFVIFGALLNLVGSSSYVLGTLRGTIQPNRVTWLLWALAPLIAFAAELGQGVGLRSLMTFMVGFGPLLVSVASLLNRKAFWHATRLDFACGALSLVALTLWALTRSGNIALVFSILADALAGLPTGIKAYKEPETENSTFFLLYAASAIITLLTVTKWNFASYGFPVFTFLICLTFFVLIRFKIGTLAKRAQQNCQ